MPTYKHKKICRLPSCKKKFETNREWQDFCHPDHQQEWHKLLRRSHEETIVEMELLKIALEKVTESFEMFKIEFEKLKNRLRASIDID